jgi:dipeptidyl aminopeptidase/acylaminoacyl peptidase
VTESGDGDGGTPFHDLGAYMAIPRITGLRLSPDGTWLAASVQTLRPDKKKYQTSIWRIDTGGGPTRRLTRSADGESGPVFLPDGSLLFVSKRPDPDKDNSGGATPAADAKPKLWLLPHGGGEAAVLAAPPGGIAVAAVARDAGTIVASAEVMPDARAGTVEDDQRLRSERRDAGVTAILHESAPVRFWDHDLGPAQLRLLAIEPDGTGHQPRDLTPEPGRALDERAFELTPDGTAVIAGWWRRDPAVGSHVELVRIEVATGERRVLLSEPGQNFEHQKVSPDGRFIVCTQDTMPTVGNPPAQTLVVLRTDPAAPAPRDLLPSLDLWPQDPVWAADSAAVYFVADENGRRHIFRADVGRSDGATGAVTRITTGDAVFTNLQVDLAGRYLYALRAAIGQPPTPVRIDLTSGAAEPGEPLPGPGTPLPVPGHVEELECTADDGQPIRAWLVLPEAVEPAPLLLWVHGGPYSSWNSWSWRWNPWLMAARGYAVLLPDPALSTGYGQHMLARGHHAWGSRAYQDVMAATDAAEKHPAIDGARIAMMGGSYGGYMANWIAGHTDRFRAIVSHASLWALDQMFSTTDEQMWWWDQFGDPLLRPQMYEANSPHLHVKNISTPMLVIHGDKDYRVPIGEALRLWGELTRHDVAAKFLYFPDENHWILTPGNATIWYETVFAFLAQHVLGHPWQRPRLL